MPRLFLVSFSVFFLAVILGYGATPGGGRSTLDILEQIFGPLRGLPPLPLMAFIFLNNSLKLFFMIVSGLALGIIPIFFLTLNGYILGVLFSEVGVSHGLGVALAALLPHGIVEIPALLFAAALGFGVGAEVLKRFQARESQVRLRLRYSIQSYVRYVLPALLLAAFLEVVVTPRVIALLAS